MKSCCEILPGRYEAVMVVESHGRNNSSAVGVEWDGQNIGLRLFQGSNTYSIMSIGKRFSLCFFSTNRMLPIVQAALLGYGTDEEEFPSHEFNMLHGVPMLANADMCIVAEVVEANLETVEDEIRITKVYMIRAIPLGFHTPPDGMSSSNLCLPIMGKEPVLVSAAALTRAIFLANISEDEKAAMWLEKTRILMKNIDRGMYNPELEILDTILQKYENKA